MSAQFLVTAVGCLSVTNTPEFPGADTFAGQSYHTGAWPHEGVDFTGRRVAVIGTGATAVQAVPEIAKQAAQSTSSSGPRTTTSPAGTGRCRRTTPRGSRRITRTCGEGPAAGFGLPSMRWKSGPRWTSRRRSASPSSRPPGPRAASTWAWGRRRLPGQQGQQRHGPPSSSAPRSARWSRIRPSRSCWRRRTIRSAPSGLPLETGYYETFNRRQRNACWTCGPCRSRRSPRTACGPASASTRSTRSSTPPASTR